MQTELNPEHVDNFKTVSQMEAQGFVGVDADLFTSLFEYGTAWREIVSEGKPAFLFVHRNPHKAGAFDRTVLAADCDVRKEWNWVNWPEFLSYLGVDESEQEQWFGFPLPHKVADLVNYYGELEIFGDSYWEGFTIAEE